MRRFKRNLQTSADNIRKFAANFQKICPKKPGTLNRYGGNYCFVARAGVDTAENEPCEAAGPSIAVLRAGFHKQHVLRPMKGMTRQ